MAIAQPGLWKRHEIVERNSILLLIGVLIVVAIGGLIEIVPLFYLKSTIEAVEGVRPYTPLELAGRNIYVREGCYLCHSQMVRPMRDEVERYGHFSLAAESMYDHPFQWGSKRTGPDLARVGGKYSDAWHREHLVDPRAVVPGSIMPAYAFLDRPLDAEAIADDLTANATLGVPYRPDMILRAQGDLAAQLDPDGADAGFPQRYPGAVLHAPGTRGRASELDALVAYLQVLGTMVDFKIYDDRKNLR